MKRHRQRHHHGASFSLSIAILVLAASCSQPNVTAPVARDLDPESVIKQVRTRAADNPPLPAIIEPNLKVTKPWKIAYVSKEPQVERPKAANDVYWYSAWLGVKETAAALNVKAEDRSIKPGVCVIHADCVLPQINIINQLVEQKAVDGIVIGPTDSFRLAAVIEKSTAAGIPVVAIDTPVDTDSVLSFVVLDSYKSGRQMGQWVAKQLNGQGNVLILTGPQTDQNAKDRHRGILAGLGGSNIVVLDTQVANWLETRAQAITADWLQEFSNVDAILSSNDAMALGAVSAIKAAQRDGILVTGYDGLPPAMDAIRAGDMAATIYQNPLLQAEIATRLLVQNLEKQSKFPPIVFIPGSPLVTQKNIPAKE